jgi:putative DNA primase/helicase
LGDFRPWTPPPATRARGELIEVSLDSSERFIREWCDGSTAWPFMPCGSMDLYRVYKKWCVDNGVRAPRESNHFLAHVNKAKGWAVRPAHVYVDQYSTTQGQKSQRMIFPPSELLELAGRARKPEEKAIDHASRYFFAFRQAVDDGY